MGAVLRSFTFGHDIWDPAERFVSSWILPAAALGALRLVFVSSPRARHATTGV